MKKVWCCFSIVMALTGCVTTDQQEAVPVVNASVPRTDRANVLEQDKTTVVANHTSANTEEVVTTVAQGETEQIQTFAIGTEEPAIDTQVATTVVQAPTGIPTTNNLNSDGKPLDGAVLALMNTAKEQEAANKLNEAAASIERAQRIAPSEPRVLYALALVRLKQGDATAAEQLSKQALSYTSTDQAELKSNLWEVIALSLDMQGDQAAAIKARQNKTVN